MNHFCFCIVASDSFDSPSCSQPQRSLMFSYNMILGQSRLNSSFWSSTREVKENSVVNLGTEDKPTANFKTFELTCKVNRYEGHWLIIAPLYTVSL